MAVSMKTDDDEAAVIRPDGLAGWLDRFVPPAVRVGGDPDALRRARLLVGGSYLLAAIAIFFIPLTWWSEGLTLNVGVLVFGMHRWERAMRIPGFGQ